MLQPKASNKIFLARTRAKAKMYEYAVPIDKHINLEGISLPDMLDLTVSILGGLAAGTESSDLEEEKYRLLFSAQYFAALVESKALPQNDILFKLLASSAYYLAGYPGSANVLLKDIRLEDIMSLAMLEQVLYFILKRSKIHLDSTLKNIVPLVNAWNGFLEQGTSAELDAITKELRAQIYNEGSNEDILFVDLVRALIMKRISVSSKAILEEFTDIEISLWAPYLRRHNALKEFWPSQVRLAQYGVFKGISAVIQMPTSAGKTRAAELIIRTCFLSGRGTLAVIVAPFRALCQEVFNDLTVNFAEDNDINQENSSQLAAG